MGAFAGLEGVWCLARMIEPPDADAARPHDLEIVYDRGPFTAAGECALMLDRAVDVLVTRNSGGDDTYAKIAAARMLGIAVVMIERPPQASGEVVGTPEGVLAWLLDQAGVRSPRD